MKRIAAFIVAAMAAIPASFAQGLPVMGKCTVMPVDVEEISGICLTAEGDSLWAVGDEGLLAKVGFDGGVRKIWDSGMDFEDITLDPSTGDLYIAVEGHQKVYRLPGGRHGDYRTVFYVDEAVDGNYRNAGLEGIAFIKGELLVGAQKDANVFTCKPDGTPVRKTSLRGLSDIKEVGGFNYDAEKDRLWLTDSETHKLYILSSDCSQVLAEYEVPWIENNESLCVDRARGCVWVASDEDNPKLYRIEFSDL